MVVGVHIVAGGPAGQGGDHLVGVHVGAGARAGLENVDGELGVMLTGCHLVGSSGDRLGQLLVEHAQFGVDPRAGALDQPQRAYLGAFQASPGDREVVHGALGLRPVQGFDGHLHLAYGVPFGAVVLGHARGS